MIFIDVTSSGGSILLFDYIGKFMLVNVKRIYKNLGDKRV